MRRKGRDVSNRRMDQAPERCDSSNLKEYNIFKAKTDSAQGT